MHSFLISLVGSEIGGIVVTWGFAFCGIVLLRSERTKIGSTLSGSLVSILVGLAASNVGIVSSEVPAYDVVLQFLLPVAVPLLLFRADLRRVIKSTGTLLLAFLLGSGNTFFHVVLGHFVTASFGCFSLFCLFQQ